MVTIKKIIENILVGLAAISAFTVICLVLALLVTSSEILAKVLLGVFVTVAFLLYAWVMGLMIKDIIKTEKEFRRRDNKKH